MMYVPNVDAYQTGLPMGDSPGRIAAMATTDCTQITVASAITVSNVGFVLLSTAPDCGHVDPGTGIKIKFTLTNNTSNSITLSSVEVRYEDNTGVQSLETITTNMTIAANSSKDYVTSNKITAVTGQTYKNIQIVVNY